MKLTVDEVGHLHELLGEGELSVCRRALEDKDCDGCCQLGTALFPGELDYYQERGLLKSDLGRIQIEDRLDGYHVIRGCASLVLDGVKNCVFGAQKPLFCKVFPRMGWRNEGEERVVFLKKSTFAAWWCPAHRKEPLDFVQRAERVKDVLAPFLREPKSWD